MVQIQKCLPKVNFERFLLLTALWDFLAELLWGGAHKSMLNLDSQHTSSSLESPEQVNVERPRKVNFERFANSSNHFSCNVGKIANGQGISSRQTI